MMKNEKKKKKKEKEKRKREKGGKKAPAIFCGLHYSVFRN